MQCFLDRYLIEKGYKLSILRDREFMSSREVLEGKAKQVRADGMGKRPNKAATIWWLLTQDFEVLESDSGVKFVQYAEGPTKTRASCLRAKVRDFQPKMFAVGGERCLVAIFLDYISRRPENLRSTGPFYLAINHNRLKDNDIWFKSQPMGVVMLFIYLVND